MADYFGGGNENSETANGAQTTTAAGDAPMEDEIS
jgi:hypothetical protein